MNQHVIDILVLGVPILALFGIIGITAWWVLVKQKYNKVFRVFDRKGNFRDYEGRSKRNKENSSLYEFEVKDFNNSLDIIEPHGWIGRKKLFYCTIDHNGNIKYLERDFLDNGSELFVPKDKIKITQLDKKVLDPETNKTQIVKKDYIQISKFDIDFTKIEKYDLRPEQKERIARKVAASHNKYGGEANKAIAGMLWTLGITIFLLLIALGWTFTQLSAIGSSFTSASSTFAKAYEKQGERELEIMQTQYAIVKAIKESDSNITFEKVLTSK